MTPYLLRYQGLAVDDYGFALDASNLGILAGGGQASTFATLRFTFLFRLIFLIEFYHIV